MRQLIRYWINNTRSHWTYGCETWAMTVTEQNRLLVFERRVLGKIYGPTQDNDGAWRIKTNEELENLIKKKKIL